MADFYSILRKSIIDRGIADSGERDVIYAQARRAMIRRLWSFEPALEEEEIERRITAFDVAVSDIEADVMAAFAGADDEPAEVEDDYRAAAAEADPYEADRYESDDYEADYREAPAYEADRRAYRAADPYEADAYETDRREADYRKAEYRQPAYQDADYGEPADPPATNSRRLPALLKPADYARQVREAGLVRYYEEARRLAPEPEEPEEPPYDDGYDARHEEEDEPPPARRARLPARRRTPDPPVDPYEDEPGYEPPPPPRRQSRADRWSTDSPRQEAREPARRQPAKAPAQRRRTVDDDLPRRRKRQRPPRRQPMSDRDKIFMLLGAIGVCALVLGGIGVYVLVPRDSGVTVDIDAHREVSDAATAVRLAAQTMPVDQTFMLFDGRDPTVFETSPDNPIRFDATAGTVRVSSSTGSPGVKALIGPGLATRLAGHNIRVTIVARSSKDAGAASMRFAYQSGVAISHWQTANLGPDYQAVALTWRVPTHAHRPQRRPAGDPAGRARRRHRRRHQVDQDRPAVGLKLFASWFGARRRQAPHHEEARPGLELAEIAAGGQPRDDAVG